MAPLAIRALALLTPFGDADQTWSALASGKTLGNDRAIPDRLLAPADDQLDRSIRIAATVAQQTLGDLNACDLGLFCATSKGPVEAMLAAADFVRQGQLPPVSLAQQMTLGAAAMDTHLHRALGLTCTSHTTVAACSSGLHALHRAARALHTRECHRALVIAADASLHPLFEASFDRLGVLAPRDSSGVRHCQPFSESAAGFFLSEAGAAILLEIPSPQSHPLALLDHTWIGTDSTALIATDPAAQTLRYGLKAFRLPDPPAFVHAHATGTRHDLHEQAAIHATFGDNVPILSHKGCLGHSLGAAGLVGVTLSTLAHRHARLWTGQHIPPATHSLTISQGFGGHVAMVRLRGILSASEHCGRDQVAESGPSKA